MRKSKASRKRVSKKIEYLIGEGKSPEQAVAMALSMEREGRLTETGAYIPVKKKQLKKSASISINEAHLVHILVNGKEWDYINEFYPEEGQDIPSMTIEVIREHGKNPTIINVKNQLAILIRDNNMPQNNSHVFIMMGYSPQDISKIKGMM